MQNRLKLVAGCAGDAPESWRQSYLGHETVPASFTEAEIAWFFSLDDWTRLVVEKRRRSLTRLGLILHIASLRLSGRPFRG